MNEEKKVSELLTANTVSANTRFVILHNAGASNASVRTITSNNILQTVFALAPTYANNSQANAVLSVGAVYKTTNGELRIVV